jgi:hypothetical protein
MKYIYTHEQSDNEEVVATAVPVTADDKVRLKIKSTYSQINT